MMPSSVLEERSGALIRPTLIILANCLDSQNDVASDPQGKMTADGVIYREVGGLCLPPIPRDRWVHYYCIFGTGSRVGNVLNLKFGASWNGSTERSVLSLIWFKARMHGRWVAAKPCVFAWTRCIGHDYHRLHPASTPQSYA